MHQKKSEVQIGKESSGVSSDFNPTPPLLFSHLSIHHKQPKNDLMDPIPSCSTPTPKTTTHKRPLTIQTNPNPNPNPSYSTSSPLSKSPTLSNSLHQYPFYSSPPLKSHHSFKFHNHPSKKSSAVRFLRHLHHLRGIRIHLRCVFLLSLPFFYFLVSHPSPSFLLDFVSAFAFSAGLLLSLNLALLRLPTILFLAKSFPTKLKSSTQVSTPHLPVFWSIGSRRKSDQLVESGCRVQVYSNGDVYEGEFHKGKCSGSGVYYYYMSGRYEGDWVDGKYDGYGVETWARGSRYRGQYRQGIRHGFGVYRFYTGDVYAGEWSNGQSHGCGIHICDDGSRFVGKFKWGFKHGLGHYHFRNGDVYAGEYFADKMHGFGLYRFANGHLYEGAWHEGRRQGLGIYTFRNGETQSGHWNNGILDVPSTQYTTCSISPVAVYHSRVLNTVQEVRRAAQKAYDIGNVDERVNRAVTAANRAANAARVVAVKAVQSQLH